MISIHDLYCSTAPEPQIEDGAEKEEEEDNEEDDEEDDDGDEPSDKDYSKDEPPEKGAKNTKAAKLGKFWDIRMPDFFMSERWATSHGKDETDVKTGDDNDKHDDIRPARRSCLSKKPATGGTTAKKVGWQDRSRQCATSCSPTTSSQPREPNRASPSGFQK